MTTPLPDARDNATGMRPPETIDRLMVGACGAIWLVFLVSRLNCAITTSDGTVLSANQNNAAQTSC